MSHGHHAAHVVKAVSEMPPLPAPKNPVLAGLAGLFLGAVGVGLYLESWTDFFVCLFVFFALTFLIPGIGAIPGWWFAAGYGAFRAATSNARR